MAAGTAHADLPQISIGSPGVARAQNERPPLRLPQERRQQAQQLALAFRPEAVDHVVFVDLQELVQVREELDACFRQVQRMRAAIPGRAGTTDEAAGLQPVQHLDEPGPLDEQHLGHPGLGKARIGAHDLHDGELRRGHVQVLERPPDVLEDPNLGAAHHVADQLIEPSQVDGRTDLADTACVRRGASGSVDPFRFRGPPSFQGSAHAQFIASWSFYRGTMTPKCELFQSVREM